MIGSCVAVGTIGGDTSSWRLWILSLPVMVVVANNVTWGTVTVFNVS